MTDYAFPSDVEIIDTNRVSLGAYLAPGTRVERDAWCSENSGSLQAVELRGSIETGTRIGVKSQGCTNPALSPPHDRIVISIDLGLNCSVEAGISITHDTDVVFGGRTLKAAALSRQDNLQYRKHNSGVIEVVSGSFH
ncbi:LbetaH domain-containing protein [Streptomyces chartreusis]|uniref:hypothetical protein n=1 Tax=Streptomyces chartreusis TaxID=1969 RepID=UPI00369E9E0A